MTPRAFHPAPPKPEADPRKSSTPRASSPARRVRHFWGMGLIESLSTLVVIAVLLGGLVLTSNSLRYGSAHEQTRSTLRRLRLAQLTFQNKHPHRALAGPTEQALATLLSDPDARALLKELEIAPDEHGRLAVRDGYGTPIRFLAAPDAPPDFVSAGKDGQFAAAAPAPGSPATQPSPTSGGSGGADDLYGSDTEGPTP